MKTIMKISLISGLLISSMALAVPQPDTDSKDSAHCHHGKHAGMMGQGTRGEGRFLDRLADRLELSTEQRSSVQAVLEKSKPQMTAIKEKMRTNRKALRELGGDSSSDDNRLQELARERGDLVASMVIERSKIRGDIQQILTEKQREQMKQMRSKHRHGGHGGHGHHEG
jgi:Spy/CpxP family protein refolding chaperone